MKDGRTLVTVARLGPGHIDSQVIYGPVHLWDIETGELRASHFGPTEYYFPPSVLEGHDVLQSTQIVDESAGKQTFLIRLLNAWTGKEIASFSKQAPAPKRMGPSIDKLSGHWSTVAPDGKTIAFVTYEGNKPRVEWRDIASGRLLGTLPGFREPARFSPNSRWLAAAHDLIIAVYEVQTGRQVGRIDTSPVYSHFPYYHVGPPNGAINPKEISPDGKLILDHCCTVWDVATGRLWFHTNGAGIDSGSLFTPDGKAFAVVTTSRAACWLAYYDLNTGQQQVEKRLPLIADSSRAMDLRLAAPDGRLLLAFGTPHIHTPSKLEKWLAKLPNLKRLTETKPIDAFVLIETETGQEIMRGDWEPWRCTPDGRYLFGRTGDGTYQLWDVPPRKPLWRFIAFAAAWSAVFGVISWWLIRRQRRASHTAGELATVSPASEFG